MSARTKFSNVERRIWRDERVRLLTAAERDVWFYLLTCDSQGSFPGLYVLRLSTAAEDLSTIDHPWTAGEVRDAIAKIESLGMAHYDDHTNVVWLPKSVEKHVEGLGPKNVKGWRNAWNEVPDCELARRAFVAAVAAIRTEGEADPKKSTCLSQFVERAPKWFEAPPPSPPPPKTKPESPIEGVSKGHRSNEKEKEKDNEKEREKEKAPAAPPPAPAHSHRVVIVPEDAAKLRPRAKKIFDRLRKASNLFPSLDAPTLAGLSRDLEAVAAEHSVLDDVPISPLLTEAITHAQIKADSVASDLEIALALKAKFVWKIADKLKELRRERGQRAARAVETGKAPPPATVETDLLAEDADVSETHAAKAAQDLAAHDAEAKATAKPASAYGTAAKAFARPAFAPPKAPEPPKRSEPPPTPVDAPAGQQTAGRGMATIGSLIAANTNVRAA